MKKNAPGALSLRMYISYGLAYALPLLVLLIITMDLRRVEYFKYFFPRFGNDLDVLQAVNIDRRFTAWENSLRTFFTVRTVGALDDFNKNDKEWETFLYDLNAAAREQAWIDALRQADENRKQILKMVDTAAQPILALQDTAERTFLPYTSQILNKALLINDLTVELRPAKSTKNTAAKPLGNDLLLVFNTAITSVIRYAITGEREMIAESRQNFLQLENTINALSSYSDPQIDKQVLEIRGIINNLYRDFDSLVENRAAAVKASGDFSNTATQDVLKAVNPLLGTEWKATTDQADNQFIERSFKRMHLFLLIGYVVLGIGLCYSFIHVYTQFQKPFYALVSYLSHGLITRKRAPVPCMNRRDDIGVLARSLNAFLERAQNQLLGTIDNPVVSGANIVDATQSSTPSNATTHHIFNRHHHEETEPAIIYQIAPAARPYLPKIELLLQCSSDFLTLAEKITDSTRRASDRARESGTFAEESRKAVQDSSTALQEITTQLETGQADSKATSDALGIVEKARASVLLKLQASRMGVARFSKANGALRGFMAELEDSLSLQHLENKGFTAGAKALVSRGEGDLALMLAEITTSPKDVHLLSKTVTQLSEALDFVAVDLRLALGMLEEAVRVTTDASASITNSHSHLNALTALLLQVREAFVGQYSRLQQAGFQLGRLALHLLEVSGDMLETEKGISNMKQTAHDIHNAAKELKKLVTE
ncbi:MAG: hypothetical protein ACK5UY_05190 [Holosporales bacterium]